MVVRVLVSQQCRADEGAGIGWRGLGVVAVWSQRMCRRPNDACC